MLAIGPWVFKKLKKPDPVEVLKRREELREAFRRRLQVPDKYGVRGEAVIRDIKKIDAYPNPNRKGVWRWFIVEVKGLYENGVEVFTGIPRRIKKDMYGSWKLTEIRDDSVTAYLVGKLPFDSIQHVDWNGDQYFRRPHIYCRFRVFKNHPFEKIAFFIKHEGSEEVYEVEVQGSDKF